MNVVVPSVESTKNESPYSAIVLASNIKYARDAMAYKIIDKKRMFVSKKLFAFGFGQMVKQPSIEILFQDVGII